MILVMRTLPLSDVKARLSELADEVERTHERLLVTKNGRDHVVVMSAADLDSIEATLELLVDHEAQARIARAREEVARGEYLDEAAVRKLVARRADGQ